MNEEKNQFDVEILSDEVIQKGIKDLIEQKRKEKPGVKDWISITLMALFTAISLASGSVIFGWLGGFVGAVLGSKLINIWQDAEKLEVLEKMFKNEQE